MGFAEAGRKPEWCLWLLLASAIALVIRFDFGTALPLNDEFFYRWTITNLAAGHGLHLWPSALPAALPQVVIGAIPAVLGASVAFIRLSVLPFLALQATFSWLIARRLGADRFWAAVAGVMLVVSPISLSVTTGLMSDPGYLALLLGTVWFAVGWIESDDGVIGTVLLASLATLQRQHAVLGAVAITLAILALKRPLQGRDRLGLAALGVGVLAALEAPFVFGFASAHMRELHSVASLIPHPGDVVGTVVEVPIMAGLFLLPLTVGLMQLRETGRTRTHWQLVPFALAVTALVAALVFTFVFGTMIYPGDQFGTFGLGPLHLGGAKPPLFTLPAFIALEVLSISTTLVLFAQRRNLWLPRAMRPSEALLVLITLSQVAPMFITSGTDRYHLAVIAPLVPFLCARISAGGVGSAAARGFAVGAALAGVLVYAAGEQDYQAWQVAREAAAQKAYSTTTPSNADAGYEANAQHFVIDAVNATGRLPSNVDPSDLGMRHSAIRLLFASPSDRSPGVSYQSLAPGRVIITHPK